METPVDRVRLRDLQVICFEYIKSKKICNALLKSDRFNLIAVVSGSLNFVENSSNVQLLAGDMYVVSGKAEIHTLTSPLCICLLSCSMDFVFTRGFEKFKIKYKEVLFNKPSFVLSLDESEIMRMIRLFGLLKEKLYYKSANFQDEIIQLWVNLILYEFSELCFKYDENIIEVHGHREKTVMNFMVLIQQNCRSHHGVKFYADSLFVSSGHLGKILRTVTGMSAKYHIDMALMSEAYLLLANKNLSITEVSDQLNFSSSASFSSFFKKYAKLSPTQYRLHFIF